GQAHEAKRQGQHKANTDADDRNKQGERYARKHHGECFPEDVPVEVDGHVRITVWSGAILSTDVLDDFCRRLVAKPFGVDLVVAAIVDDGLDGIVGLFNPFTALGKDKAIIDGVVGRANQLDLFTLLLGSEIGHVGLVVESGVNLTGNDGQIHVGRFGEGDDISVGEVFGKVVVITGTDFGGNLLAVEVFQLVDGVVILEHHDAHAMVVIGNGEINDFLAFFSDVDGRYGDVDLVGLNAGDDSRKRHGFELVIKPGAVGDFAQHVHVESHVFTGFFIAKLEWGKAGIGGRPQDVVSSA